MESRKMKTFLLTIFLGVVLATGCESTSITGDYASDGDGEQAEDGDADLDWEGVLPDEDMDREDGDHEESIDDDGDLPEENGDAYDEERENDDVPDGDVEGEIDNENPPCLNDADCQDAAGLPRCVAGACVECRDHGDCPEGWCDTDTANHCEVRICEPGAAWCDGDVRHTCDGIGSGETTEICADQNACTVDSCDGGQCVHAAIDCNGHGECREDSGNCSCYAGYTGDFCDACVDGVFGTYPDCFYPDTDFCDQNECWPVPPTGQTKCYTWETPWEEIACPGEVTEAACSETPGCGQDAQYPDRERGFSAYLVEDDVVVEDSLTGLVWQKAYVENKTWQEAVDHCDGLMYAGFDDWRLPNAHELRSMADYQKNYPASSFPDMPSSSFWSSSDWSHDIGQALYVIFTAAGVYQSEKTNLYAVRCVRLGFRSGDSRSETGRDRTDALQRYIVGETMPEEPTVLDTVTGLVWQKTYANSRAGKNWAAALAYCEGLDYGGFSDWRLPNGQELASLVDYGRSSPATRFPDHPAGGYFWTSTTPTHPNSLGSGMTVTFGAGVISFYSKANLQYVRCVRDGP